MVVRRAHTTANVAPALRTLLDQVNAAYPKRSKASDGVWPSKAHTAASPNSDHEAGNALDITDNLGGGATVTHAWLDPIRRDPRVKYVIHDGRIGDAAGWRAYTGSNPHKTHAHVSVHESRRRDARAWAMYVPKKEVPNVTRNYAGATIVDMGDATHRAALKALAVKWQDKLVPGVVAVSVHAETGGNLDAYIAYAKANGLEMHTITNGEASTMVLRSSGKVPTTTIQTDVAARAALKAVKDIVAAF